MYGRGPPPSEVGVALHAGPAAGPPLQLAPAKVEEVDREKVPPGLALLRAKLQRVATPVGHEKPVTNPNKTNEDGLGRRHVRCCLEFSRGCALCLHTGINC